VPALANPDTRILEMKSLDTEYERVKAHYRAEMIERLDGGYAHHLRQKSVDLAKEFAPIEVAEFPC
jgi:hypothetical protein